MDAGHGIEALLHDWPDCVGTRRQRRHGFRTLGTHGSVGRLPTNVDEPFGRLIRKIFDGHFFRSYASLVAAKYPERGQKLGSGGGGQKYPEMIERCF